MALALQADQNASWTRQEARRREQHFNKDVMGRKARRWWVLRVPHHQFPPHPSEKGHLLQKAAKG